LLLREQDRRAAEFHSAQRALEHECSKLATARQSLEQDRSELEIERQALEQARLMLQQQQAKQFEELAAQQSQLRAARNELGERETKLASCESELQSQAELVERDRQALSLRRDEFEAERRQFAEESANLRESLAHERRLQLESCAAAVPREPEAAVVPATGAHDGTGCRPNPSEIPRPVGQTAGSQIRASATVGAADQNESQQIASRVMQRMVQRNWEPRNRRWTLWAGVAAAVIVTLLLAAAPFAWPLLAGR
jgi:hypothetical protein